MPSKSSAIFLLILLLIVTTICDARPNPVPPNSSQDPLVEEHDTRGSAKPCKPLDVFKVNCYNCWCNRMGTMAICKKARKCLNPEAPKFIMFPEST